MALNFPDSPTDGQVYTEGSNTWIWSAATGAWVLEGVYTRSQVDALLSGAELTSLDARLTALEGQVTILGGTTPNDILIDNNAPQIGLRESDEPIDNRIWQIRTLGGHLTIGPRDDAGVGSAASLYLYRDGKELQDLQAYFKSSTLNAAPTADSILTRRRGDSRYYTQTQVDGLIEAFGFVRKAIFQTAESVDTTEYSTTTTSLYGAAGPILTVTPATISTKLIVTADLQVELDADADTRLARGDFQPRLYNGTAWVAAGEPARVGGAMGESGAASHWAQVSFSFHLGESDRRSDTGDWTTRIWFSTHRVDAPVRIRRAAFTAIEVEE